MKTGEMVAIKKLRRVFDTPSISRRTIREVKLLRHLCHENIVSLVDITSPETYDLFSDIYLVTELMDTDLHKIIRSKQTLSDSHIQYFIYQILRGLKYIHSAGVLHRDLKPSNILVNANCDCKIADFGMARTAVSVSDIKEKGKNKGSLSAMMTGYVTTRWYRAPEIILSWRIYTKAVDLWSVGCILAELLGRTPIFPGKNYNHQLRLIFGTLGTPKPSDVTFIKCQHTKAQVLAMTHKNPIPLKQLYPHAEPECLSLLRWLLEFVPNRRATVADALQHRYLENLHDSQDEPDAESEFNFAFERALDLDSEACKRLLWKETCKYHPHLDPLPGLEIEKRADVMMMGAPARSTTTSAMTSKTTILTTSSAPHAHNPESTAPTPSPPTTIFSIAKASATKTIPLGKT
eukprot:CAMPEP_0185254826 /NCGR_PEP_ID=MMETSP1359-20130426/3769_1 /TAXON_ID=552665 /ORGANISM="Bigelowiella longifila, Strain CCMP242" /LENGTH=404 /DNA_ID=CAMNT_0027838251 /DNA_START=529 /DNA_END=1743 /DNA_ORIENTATION=+